MYKLILSFRYLFHRRISYLALLAVALCVFVVVVVMTVMTGLVTDFRQKNHDFVGDCVIGTESLVGFAYYEDFVKILDEKDFVEGVSPVIKSYALINPDWTDRSWGVEIIGIDPVRHSAATGFGSTVYYHKDDMSKAFEPPYDPNLAGCVLGIDLAMDRDTTGRYIHTVVPERIAYSVTCFPLTAKGALAKAGAGEVSTKTFYYSDTSQSGLARVDDSLVYLPFEQAQLLCGMAGQPKRASAIYVKFRPNIKIDGAREKVALLWRKFVEEKSGAEQAELLNKVTVQSWQDYRRQFIAIMEKEQTMMAVMFALVGITTVFIVFVVFYMIVSHKSKDIGILKSIGASNVDIVELFSGLSLLVGVLGSGLGLLAGWMFLLKMNRIESWLFEHFKFQLWDRMIYAIGDIPTQVEISVLAVIVVSAIVACLAGALLPSWKAAGLNPVESLQVSQL